MARALETFLTIARTLRGRGLLVSSAVGLLCLIAPALASAAECTDTWIGPSESSWQTAEFWSAEHPPTSTDVVCIPSGASTRLESGAAHAEVLQGEGAVELEEGTLTIAGTAEDSNIGTLRASGGVLNGPAKLFVTASLVGIGGSLEGVGSTVIGAEATATVNQPESEEGAGLRIADKHTVLNHGTFKVNGPAGKVAVLTGATLENTQELLVLGKEASIREDDADIVNEGHLEGEGGEAELRAEGGTIENGGWIEFLKEETRIKAIEGARLENLAHLIVDGEGRANGLAVGEAGETPILKNTGTLLKDSGEGRTYVGFQTNNLGTIKATAGQLSFIGGGSSGSGEKSWIAESEVEEAEKVEILFQEDVYSLGDVATIRGEVRVLPAASVSAGRYEAEGSSIYVEEGVFKFTNAEAASHFGLLDIIGSEVAVPSKEHATAGFVGIADGSLEIKQEAKLTSEYLEEVSGSVEVFNWAELAGNGIGHRSGSITVDPHARVAESEIEQNGGNLLFEPESTLAEINSIEVEAGTVHFGEDTKSTIYDIYQRGGSVEFAHTDYMTINTWEHYDGPAVIGAGIEASITTFESHEGGVTIHSGTSLSGTTTDVTGGSFFLESSSQLNHEDFVIQGGTVTIASESAVQSSYSSLEGGELRGSGLLHDSVAFTWSGGTMAGSGSTVTKYGDISEPEEESSTVTLEERLLKTEGAFYFESSTLAMSDGARLLTSGEFAANSETEVGSGAQIRVAPSSSSKPKIINHGAFEKEHGGGTTAVDVPFENLGVVNSKSGHLHFGEPIGLPDSVTFGPRKRCGDPVDCATGVYADEQTDLSIGGRGVGLDFVRSYSSELAEKAEAPGPLGYGWTTTFSDRLAVSEGGAQVTYRAADGSVTVFQKNQEEELEAPPWSQDVLSEAPGGGYDLEVPDRLTLSFAESGALQAERDKNGNETTLQYSESGRLASVTDPAGRQLKFSYDEAGLLEKIEDPMGRVVSYGYSGDDLATVTLPGAESPSWQFEYDAQHRLTSEVDGRGDTTTNEYDGPGRVVEQVGPTGAATTFEYSPFETVVTNQSTGSVTDEWFTSNNEPFKVTHGFGTPGASTETFSYNEAGLPVEEVDGDGNVTTYEYNGAGDRTEMKTAAGAETQWTYNTHHEVVSETTPGGETTTIARDSDGNPEAITRPAPEEKVQRTTYAYGPHGEPESRTDSLEHTWTYEYDSQGDLTAETDPDGNTRTWKYNEDSEEVAITSPAGNLPGAETSKFMTTIERDGRGLPIKITNGLGGTITKKYDGDGNVVAETDPREQTTEYVYDGDNQLIRTEYPTGAVTEREYDGAGEISTETNAVGGVTTYVRNALEEPTEVEDPLGRIERKEYDAAGNLTKTVNAEGQTTEYSYDSANRPVTAAYSESRLADVTWEYDANGNVTGLTDGSGASSFEYDCLGRMTRSEDGHGDVVGYAYDLDNQQTKILYPNGRSVEQEFDAAGNLAATTDWDGHKTTFGYGPDANLQQIVFPESTGDVDQYTYDPDDRMVEAKFSKGEEALASFGYERDSANLIINSSSAGVPEEGEATVEYDQTNRLTGVGPAKYEYDGNGSVTKSPQGTYEYDNAGELELGPSGSFSYNGLGERTAATPTEGAPTAYAYNQAGELMSVERAAEGEEAAVEESFIYDGDGLMMSATTGGQTNYLAWGRAGALSPLLSAGGTSYIYGPGGLPVEEVSEGGTVTYIHHDQQGSSRLLTNGSGEPVVSLTYSPYGALEGASGARRTALGFAGQYTLPDSGLQYFRARFYDPSTAQFLSQNPEPTTITSLYEYAGDNPLAFSDPSGRCIILCLPSPGEVLHAAGEVVSAVGNAAGEVVNAVSSAVRSPAGQIVTGVVTGVACLAGPEVCVPVALANVDIHVGADVVHAIFHPEAMPTLTGDAFADVASGALSALPGGVVDKELYESLVQQGGSKFAYYQLQALAAAGSTMLGVAWSNLGC